MATNGNKLTPKQRRFVEEYCVDLNGTQAALRAGYAPKNAAVQAHYLLRNPKVRAVIDERRWEMSEASKLDAIYVLEGLKRNAERAGQAEPVLDKEGNPTGEYTYQGSVVNRALELIGKHFGVFPERHELTGEGGGPVTFRVVYDDANKTEE